MSPALSKVEGTVEWPVMSGVEWRNILWVVLAYALITAVVTCPVAFRLRSALAGAADQDALQHLWISWWTEKALLDLGTSPAQASYLYYPDGTYHPMLWVTPYPQVVALPLQLLFGQVVAYNLHLFLSFVLTGLTTYLLCTYLTRNRENTVYLGGVTLLLAGWGTRRRWREARFWLMLALAGMVLSLGPVLKIGGRQTNLPLPYALLQRLPFYKWGRIPGRANETIVLPLAVLASLGTASLLERFELWPRLRKLVPGGLVAILSMLILFDYVVAWPFPAMDVRVPDFYQRMAQERGDFAVLDLPQWPIWLREVSNRAMHYQTVHQHKIVGGYVWRLPEGLEGGMKALQELVLPPVREDMIPRPSPEEARQALNRYHIRYVVLHKGIRAAEEDQEALTALRRLLGEPFYNDQRLAAFLVPEAEVEGDEEGLLALSYGWYQVEDADGHPARWLKDEGILYVHRLTEGRYGLRFTATPFQGPRHVQVTVNGQAVAEFEVKSWQEFATPPFRLTKGQNDIVFQVAEGCEVPAEVEAGSNDKRCLSVLFQDMHLTPAVEGAGKVLARGGR